MWGKKVSSSLLHNLLPKGNHSHKDISHSSNVQILQQPKRILYSKDNLVRGHILDNRADHVLQPLHKLFHPTGSHSHVDRLDSLNDL